MKQYIKFQSGNDMDRLISEFSTWWGVTQCFGAVDGCHIPICDQNEQCTDYHNRKGWCSMTVQGLVEQTTAFWMSA